jgi:uncharacterized protein YggE
MNEKFFEKNHIFLVIVTLSLSVFLLSNAWLSYQRAKNIVDPSRAITFSATGKAYAISDIAKINFTVINKGKEAKIVQQENNRRVSKIIKEIKDLNISEKDIKTKRYSLIPEYDYYWCREKSQDERTCPPKIIGYSLEQSVEVTIRDFNNIEPVINILSLNQVDEVSDVSFEIEDIENVKNLARIDALNKIQERAKLISEKTGLKLGKILEISENYPMLYDNRIMTLSAKEKALTPNEVNVSIEPGQEEVTVTMTVKYEIK